MSLERQLAGIVGEQGVDDSAGLPLAIPTDERQAVELFALARTDGLRLKLMGLGSKLAWMRTPANLDFAISTRRLSGVVEFEAGDGTLTALAGTTLQELRDATRAAGLELSPDVPRPQRATLGGVIAAGASGPDRARHGAGRLHVLGTQALLADGRMTKSGGRLVKNVTGYDLHRLYCGSHGTLALILEASLRLFPAPEARRALRHDFGKLEDAVDFSTALAGAGVAPRTVTLLRADDRAGWSLHVGLAGRAAQLELEAERLNALREADEHLEGEAASSRFDELRDAEPDPGERTVLHLTSRVSRLREACGVLFDALEGLPHEVAVLQPTVATLDLALASGADASLPERVTAARTALAPLGARLALRGAILDRCEVDPVATPGPELVLMRRLKQTYDPAQLLAGGGFHGGL